MQAHDLMERITVDPNVCFGKPTVRGTRIWVGLVLDLLADGMTIAEILDEYPSLTDDDVRACLAYGARLERSPLRRRRVKLKLDENLGRRWSEQLRNAGHDVHTIWDEQLSGAHDADVLAAAVDEGRALVTLDLDFANPLRFPPDTTAGIAVLRLRDHSGRDELDALIGALARALEGSDPTGHLWIVDRARVRQYEEPTD